MATVTKIMNCSKKELSTMDLVQLKQKIQEIESAINEADDSDKENVTSELKKLQKSIKQKKINLKSIANSQN